MEMQSPPNLRHYVRPLCVMLIALVCCACQSPSVTRDAGSKLSVAGVQACDAALAFYDQVEQVSTADKQQQDFARMASSPTPDVMPDTHAVKFALQLTPRRLAFKNLREAYTEFGLLSDTAYGDQTSKAASLVDSVGAINVPDVSDDVKQLAVKISGDVISQIQAGEIKTHSRELAKISDLYSQLWQSDADIWKKRFLDEVDKEFADELWSAPKQNFDQAAIDKAVETPLASTYKFSLYKMQRIVDSHKSTDLARQQLEAVSAALVLIEQAHADLGKDQPPMSAIQYSIETALSYLDIIMPKKKGT